MRKLRARHDDTHSQRGSSSVAGVGSRFKRSDFETCPNLKQFAPALSIYAAADSSPAAPVSAVATVPPSLTVIPWLRRKPIISTAAA